MTESKWLNFAGFLNSCIYELDHPECPFKNAREMDQYQKLEFMLSVKESNATAMMQQCQSQKCNCSPTFIHTKQNGWILQPSA